MNRNDFSAVGSHWRRRSIRAFAFVIIPLVLIALAITFISIRIHQDSMRSLVGERDQRTAQSIAATLGQQLDHRGKIVQDLAEQTTDQPNDQIDSLIESYLTQPDFHLRIAYYSSDGERLGFSGDVAFWESAAQVTEELLAQLQVGERSGVVFSLPWRYPDQTGEQFVFVADSSPDTENAPAVIGAFSVATLAESTIEPVFAEPPAETGEASGYLVAQNYEIIYRTESASKSFSPQDHPGVVQALRGERGRNGFQSNGKEYVYAYSPVEPTGWALVIQEPWETVSSPLLNTTLLLPLLILIPVILLAMTVIGFGVRKVLLPLQGLEQKSAELAWGDFEAIETPVGGIDEIDHLQNTLIHLAQKIKRSQEGLRGYIGAITTGQENERQRLARELHDDTIQALIALNQRVHLALMDLEPCDAYNQLSKIQGLTEETIQNLRRLTQGLRPQYLEDLGLVPALQVLTQQRDQRAKISIDFKVTGDQWRLEPDVELALYRITQEGLNNIIQHAQASHAFVQLRYNEPNGLRLSIKDDGIGFIVPESPAEFAPQGHFGLLGIYERAEMINARLEIESSPGEGTTLTIALDRAA